MSALRVHRRSIAGAGVAVIVLVAGAFAWNVAFGHGCSLLPVALPEPYSQAWTPEQACAALGYPLPSAAVVPDGVHVAWTAISPGGPGNIPRMATLAYVRGNEGVGQLEVVRSAAIPPGDGEVNATVAGLPAIVTQTHIADINLDDVHYLWVRDGVLLSLHVHLIPGISRAAADAMAASIR